jgi:hypothetical protein
MAPETKKKASQHGSPMADPDHSRPVMDNAKGYTKSKMSGKSSVNMGIHPSHHDSKHRPGAVMHSGKDVSSGAQQASSLPGSLSIIDPHGMTSPKDKTKDGIPGIIATTTEGAQTRARLVGGIIESPMSDGKAPSGPVHAVMGHDATAYNAGMKHIAGSSFTSRH